MVSAGRAWVHSSLANDTPLNVVIGGRVMQQGAMLSAQQTKPYIVHHFGNATDEGFFDEDGPQPYRQYLTIYIHTDRGDYGPIDEIVPLVKAALYRNFLSRPPELAGLNYLETSQDLQDDLLQTYFRYVRFQLAFSR